MLRKGLAAQYQMHRHDIRADLHHSQYKKGLSQAQLEALMVRMSSGTKQPLAPRASVEYVLMMAGAQHEELVNSEKLINALANWKTLRRQLADIDRCVVSSVCTNVLLFLCL